MQPIDCGRAFSACNVPPAGEGGWLLTPGEGHSYTNDAAHRLLMVPGFPNKDMRKSGFLNLNVI